ncbi:MAG: cobyrinic acid a,c-diamide synthase [Candidatus Muproteobacteria bacterium RIFCSPHIGHO2_01_FULL_65_16]|uniref:Cobyrinate a,c-diamide synthase n=1 Tax=Candidatus Muproteobacteria bacterium RIFCSPHIGHO2_01_FULL_65_16 TaxID=1817764 RepID=A0A1F6TMI5_9PROT|nr:MAG: cobyrinic acid a,c-diamide synthase [Candidatus Muproteobacteria bacterium RIFCSPHIGHO2_01_FULL_65_16]
MNRLLISAAHKSSGKTTITLGLAAALRARGLAVQPFKKGPDYIDPMWLSLASGRDCHNLDFYLMGRGEILRTFVARARGADLALIEGNKGLYDGLALDGGNSNAALAQLLGTPVVLVIDARGMTRGIAPLILGYQAFDRDIRIAGVILNRLGGARHESRLRGVIEHYTDVPVLGAVHEDESLAIVERHLGLMPSNESGAALEKISAIAAVVARQVDLDRLLAVAAAAPALPVPAGFASTLTRASPASGSGDLEDAGKEPSPLPLSRSGGRGGVGESLPFGRGEPSALRATSIRLGIARDAAFGFYYPGDLEALRAAGAELVPFDTLRDPRLPAVDALFLGGGFPETHMEALQANAALRRDIKRAIAGGLPVYAECGGLMYLTRGISWNGRRCEMVGAIPADTVMHAKPQGRGYVLLRETGKGPWPAAGAGGAAAEIKAHEFHYSGLENLAPDLEYAYEVLRGAGVDGRRDGIVYNNVLACYSHMRDLEGNHWTARFVEFVRQCQKASSKWQVASSKKAIEPTCHL